MKIKALKTTRGSIVVSLMMLSACMTGRDDHLYVDGHCITCLNNPITGVAYNYSKSSPDYQQAKKYQRKWQTHEDQQLPYQTDNVRFSVKQPVDQVYLKLKREFGFYTRKERERSFGQNKAWLANADEFRYEAISGVSYHMREYTQHRYQNNKHELTLDALLESNGSGTNIVFTYWIQHPQSTLPDYGKSIKTRALRALR